MQTISVDRSFFWRRKVRGLRYRDGPKIRRRQKIRHGDSCASYRTTNQAATIHMSEYSVQFFTLGLTSIVRTVKNLAGSGIQGYFPRGP